jgi:hypothetical protein
MWIEPPMQERYIKGVAGANGRSKGWLSVKLEPSGTVEAVVEHTRVTLTSSTPQRDYFTFVEGPHKGKAASAKRPSATQSHLSSSRPAYRRAATLTFNIAAGSVNWGGASLKAITHHLNPVSVGIHPLQLPDFPHDLGLPYLDRTPYALHWFYLGHGHATRGANDRYLHAGTASAGCITVTDVSGWGQLYEHLILCRGLDNTIGTVHVVR